MNLVEFEAKRLLREAGLPVPAGELLPLEHGGPVGAPCVLKAQIAEGGRGKRGLVVPVAGPAEAGPAFASLRARMRAGGHGQALVLREAAVAASAEYYLAWSIDDVAQQSMLCFSLHGGVEVEAQAGSVRTLHLAPGQLPVAYQFVDFFAGCGVQGRALAALCRFACTSWRVFVQHDAQLLEVNPLAVLASGELMALDAKIVLDDNAAPRHGEWAGLHSAQLAEQGASELERRAAAAGFSFVELDGEIAMLAGGAGIGMAILDILADAGMPAANFADASGGSGTDAFESLGRIAFARAEQPQVRAILMYFTLAATSVASVVRGVMRLLDAAPPPKPLVIGLLCCGAAEREMTFAQAQAAFAARGLRCEPGLPEALQALRQLRFSTPD